MKARPSGTQADLFEKYFPGESYTTSFEPSPEQRVAMTRHAQSYARDGDELKLFLMAFGLMAYDSSDGKATGGPGARRKRGNADLSSTHCKNEHPRVQFSRIGGDGYWRCLACERASKSRQRAKRKQQAA